MARKTEEVYYLMRDVLNTLPSPSLRYARMTFSKKVEGYKELLPLIAINK